MKGFNVIFAKFANTKLKTKRNGFAYSRGLQAASHVCQFTKSHCYCALTLFKKINIYFLIESINGHF